MSVNTLPAASAEAVIELGLELVLGLGPGFDPDALATQLAGVDTRPEMSYVRDEMEEIEKAGMKKTLEKIAGKKQPYVDYVGKAPSMIGVGAHMIEGKQ